MSAIDVEKTQIWFSNVKEKLETPPVTPEVGKPAGTAKPPVFQKPKLPLKKMSKEEKILLATGGALAVGLGAIVITSLPSEAAPLPPEPSAIDLTTPVLDLEGPEETPATLPEIPVPPSQPRAPRYAAPPRAEPAPPEAPKAPPALTALDTSPLINLPDTPPVATSVSDESPFMEAYETARAEVGPGGLFAWRGTFYSTFTEAEWESAPAEPQERWLDAANQLIDPEPEPTPKPPPGEHVFVADRSPVTWTGIDRNEDGDMEVLIARVEGQAPMVLMDTDADGALDTRYDYNPATGKTTVAGIDPFRMTESDVTQIEYVEVGPDMGFFNTPENVIAEYEGIVPVAITERENSFFVEIDYDNDYIIDTISVLRDGEGPIVGMDLDGDGRIETGFAYDPEGQNVIAMETEPLDPLVLDIPEAPQIGDRQEATDFYPGEEFNLLPDEETGGEDTGYDDNSALTDDLFN